MQNWVYLLTYIQVHRLLEPITQIRNLNLKMKADIQCVNNVVIDHDR